MNKDDVIENNWTDWFDMLKLVNPASFDDFMKILTDIVKQYPQDASVVTVEDLTDILTET